MWPWAEARAAGLKQLWPVWPMAYDTILDCLMQARGFVVIQVDLAPPLFEPTLDELPAITLLDIFTVQGLRTPDDSRLRA
jgi:hypothetical protein